MNLLQRTFRAIGAQLGGLPTTAKLLIGALMVILVTAFWDYQGFFSAMIMFFADIS